MSRRAAPQSRAARAHAASQKARPGGLPSTTNPPQRPARLSAQHSGSHSASLLPRGSRARPSRGRGEEDRQRQRAGLPHTSQHPRPSTTPNPPDLSIRTEPPRHQARPRPPAHAPSHRTGPQRRWRGAPPASHLPPPPSLSRAPCHPLPRSSTSRPDTRRRGARGSRLPMAAVFSNKPFQHSEQQQRRWNDGGGPKIGRPSEKTWRI